MPDTPHESPPSGTDVLPYAQPDARPRLDPLAVAGVTCAFIAPCVMLVRVQDFQRGFLLLLFVLLATAAVVLGCSAQKNERNTRRQRAAGTFALRLGASELLLIVLAYVILPPYGGGLDRGNRVKCSLNLRMIGLAIDRYSSANGGQLPTSLEVLLNDPALDPAALVCPSSNHERPPGDTPQERIRSFRSSHDHCSYVYLGARLTRDTIAPRQILAYESLENHERGICVLYGDGTSEYWRREGALRMIADLRAGHNPPRIE